MSIRYLKAKIPLMRKAQIIRVNPPISQAMITFFNILHLLLIKDYMLIQKQVCAQTGSQFCADASANA
jgi:hypothetical protein